MSVPRLVVGCPVWDRSWCLPIYFDSLLANVDPADTGLVFVVPPNDTHSRAVIEARGGDFAFVEVLRDKYEQFNREIRRRDNHGTLAQARNLLLQHVCQVGPEWFLSWDSDFLVSPGVVAEVLAAGKPVTTIWAWLNRKPPRRGQHWDEDTKKFVPVEWNDPVNATAMQWDVGRERIAVHLDPRKWAEHAQGLWRCDVALAWQLMQPVAFRTARYDAHPHGEDIPFNWALEQRGIERWCYGEQPGLHLFDRASAEGEIAEGYPQLMHYAEDDLPLAATRPEPESDLLRAIGFYPQLEDGLVSQQ